MYPDIHFSQEFPFPLSFLTQFNRVILTLLGYLLNALK